MPRTDLCLCFIPTFFLYVHKCKLFSFYRTDSFVMLLFSQLSSCLLNLFFVSDPWREKSREKVLELCLILQTIIQKKIQIVPTWCTYTHTFIAYKLYVLQLGMIWVKHHSIFHPSVVCNLFNRGFVFQLEIFCGSSPLKWKKAGRRDICLAFNGYHKCFSNSTPSETSLPFSTLPNYSNGMKLRLFALQSLSVFPS